MDKEIDIEEYLNQVQPSYPDLPVLSKDDIAEIKEMSQAHLDSLNEEPLDNFDVLKFERNASKAVIRNLIIALDQIEQANDKIGNWLSAALHDPRACDALKQDINEWFDKW